MSALILLVSLEMRRRVVIDFNLQVDKDLAGSRLGHVEINDLGRDLAGLVIDTCLVGTW